MEFKIEAEKHLAVLRTQNICIKEKNMDITNVLKERPTRMEADQDEVIRTMGDVVKLDMAVKAK